MYGDLRSKLQIYKENQGKRPEKPVSQGLDIHVLLEGAVCENESGKYFVIEKKYPLKHMHGGFSLGNLLVVDFNLFGYIFNGIGESLSIRDMLFLDTETTGLSSGTGTVAFLIGTGFFKEDCFVLRQYFMRDYDEEPAVLKALNELLSGFKGIVSFNGKAFDWNLLNSRFSFNRLRMSMREPVHMDLLFPARKIWKLKLESCKLTRLEEAVLNEYRTGDVPGEMIPSIYFKYLEDRNATEIKKVIIHNEMDIVSMLSLMSKMHNMLENPLSEAECHKELLGIGRIFEDTKRYDAMINCYQNCTQSNNRYVKETASKRLAAVYKRNKDYEKAVKQWEYMLSNGSSMNLYPLIELAKYYEHRKGDINKALELVDRAIQSVAITGLYDKITYAEIKKRYERLKRKAGIMNA